MTTPYLSNNSSEVIALFLPTFFIFKINELKAQLVLSLQNATKIIAICKAI